MSRNIRQNRSQVSSAKRGPPGPVREQQRRARRQAEVQDGVHHARHADRGAGAHGDEQRTLDAAERSARRLFEPMQRVTDFGS